MDYAIEIEHLDTLELDPESKSYRLRRNVLAGDPPVGHTTVDWLNRTGQEPNANLVLEMDTERFWELLQAAVR